MTTFCLLYGEANLSRGCFASRSITLCSRTALGQEKFGFCPLAGQGEYPGKPLRLILSLGRTAGTGNTTTPTKQGKDRLPSLFNAFPSLHNQPQHLSCPSAAPPCLHKRKTCPREVQHCWAGLRQKYQNSGNIPEDGWTLLSNIILQAAPASPDTAAASVLPPLLYKKEVGASLPWDLSQFS